MGGWGIIFMRLAILKQLELFWFEFILWSTFLGTKDFGGLTVSIFHLDPAKIIKRQNSTVQVGGYAALICRSEGNPTPVITWARDKTNEVIGYGSTLVLCSAQLYDGWYTCSSANSLGKDRASVYLEVIGKNDYLIQSPNV